MIAIFIVNMEKMHKNEVMRPVAKFIVSFLVFSFSFCILFFFILFNRQHLSSSISFLTTPSTVSSSFCLLTFLISFHFCCFLFSSFLSILFFVSHFLNPLIPPPSPPPCPSLLLPHCVNPAPLLINWQIWTVSTGRPPNIRIPHVRTRDFRGLVEGREPIQRSIDTIRTLENEEIVRQLSYSPLFTRVLSYFSSWWSSLLFIVIFQRRFLCFILLWILAVDCNIGGGGGWRAEIRQAR